MIDHLLFYKLKPEVDEGKLEDMIRMSRSLLLKIPVVLTVRSGRTIDPESDWPFYILLEFDSLDKKRIFQDDPNYLKFLKVIVDPNTSKSYSVDYETDPSKDIKYS